MVVALYGYENDCLAFRTFASDFEVQTFSSTEDFIPALSCQKFDAIFVLMDNASGMEGAITARHQQPKTPLIWFSNDKGFAAQAYRLNAEYFAIKPLKQETMEIALDRCKKSAASRCDL